MPKHILSEEKFKATLIDIHLLEGKLELQKNVSDTLFYMAGRGYERVFEKHGISQEQFEETFEYYRSEPKKFDKLYETIVEELSKAEAKTKEVTSE